MADILTQLQTTYDQLLTQFFSTISYLSQRHPLVAPDSVSSDPYTNPPVQFAPSFDNQNPPPSSSQPSAAQPVVLQPAPLQPGPEDSDPGKNARPLRPDTPTAFAAAQKDLAEDLIRKGVQLEFLIARLPGIGRGELDQEQRIRELAEQVREMEAAQKAKRREMRRLVERLDAVVMGMATSVKMPAGIGETNDLNGHV